MSRYCSAKSRVRNRKTWEIHSSHSSLSRISRVPALYSLPHAPKAPEHPSAIAEVLAVCLRGFAPRMWIVCDALLYWNGRTHCGALEERRLAGDRNNGGTPVPAGAPRACALHSVSLRAASAVPWVCHRLALYLWRCYRLGDPRERTNVPEAPALRTPRSLAWYWSALAHHDIILLRIVS